MKKIKIGNKTIGKGYPPFIIAEAGVNHNGDINLAKKLVDTAKENGADAVKFQTYKTENLVTKDTEMANYQKNNIGKEISQYTMLKKLELNYDDFPILKKYCDKKDIVFLSTPHTYDAIDFLEKLVPAYKFGSGDITNIPALKHAAIKEKPIILGTGMSTLKDVKLAVETIRNEGNEDIIILHCTTNYPCPFDEVNLKAMITMMKEIPECLVGYSDHTQGIEVSLAAVSLGALVIEKHFTLNKNLEGPDHKASLDPNKLKDLTKSIKDKKYSDMYFNKEIFGKEEKEPTENELKISKLVRKSVVASKDIKKRERLTFDNLMIKRPGTGLHPKEIYNLVGKYAKLDIKKDDIIRYNMIT